MRTTRVARPASRRRAGLTRLSALLGAAGVIAATTLIAPAATARFGDGAPASLSDSEFWEFFTKMSEPGGNFVSENFVSNEMSYQLPIPTLQATLTSGGVYLGVGPEQNFTYIANLKPRMAVIFDIRRQNAMQHLMFKALFELSPTRAEFVSRLFSRPLPHLGKDASAEALFDSASAAAESDDAYRANHDAIIRTLTKKHGFALSDDDITLIDHVYEVFTEAGPEVNYSYRAGMGSPTRTPYPTFGTLQEVTNADSVPMGFLASEENYRTVREMELRNLVVPVVGDFGGPKAIRAVGEYLRAHKLWVTAFYLSNVEQYLFRQGGASERFYGNVASLPLDSTATFIRSVPSMGSFGGFGGPIRIVQGAPAGSLSTPGISFFSVTIMDSGGVRTTRVMSDSAGVPVIRVSKDSGGRTLPVLPDSARAGAPAPDSLVDRLRAMIASRDSMLQPNSLRGRPLYTVSRMMGGLLTSGIASMRETLDAYFAGRLLEYDNVIAMTKTDGWK